MVLQRRHLQPGLHVSNFTLERLLISFAFASLTANILFFLVPNARPAGMNAQPNSPLAPSTGNVDTLHRERRELFELTEKARRERQELAELRANLEKEREELRLERADFMRSFAESFGPDTGDGARKSGAGSTEEHRARAEAAERTRKAEAVRAAEQQQRRAEEQEVEIRRHAAQLGTEPAQHYWEREHVAEGADATGEQGGTGASELAGHYWESAPEGAGDKRHEGGHHLAAAGKIGASVALCSVIWDATALIGNPFAVPGVTDNMVCGALAGAVAFAL